MNIRQQYQFDHPYLTSPAEPAKNRLRILPKKSLSSNKEAALEKVKTTSKIALGERDPTGHFSMPAHLEMTANAGLFAGYTEAEANKIAEENVMVDYRANTGDYHSQDHFDNLENYQGVREVWDKAVNDIVKGDRGLTGKKLHPIQDFYSHSNYIQLAKSHFNDTPISEIPTFQEVNAQPEKYKDFTEVLKKELKTGRYDDSQKAEAGLQQLGYNLPNEDPSTHTSMNLDTPGKTATYTTQDGKSFTATHEEAVNLATRESTFFLRYQYMRDKAVIYEKSKSGEK